MKRSTKRIFMPAHFSAAIVVAALAYWLNTKFPAMNWSSPWLWGLLAIVYVMIAGPFVLGATIHETAKHVTDTGAHVPHAAPPPPPPPQPRGPMPRVFKIVGIAVGVPLASFIVMFIGLMVYFLFNPTPEMLAKAETRRIDAEIQRIETEQRAEAARRAADQAVAAKQQRDETAAQTAAPTKPQSGLQTWETVLTAPQPPKRDVRKYRCDYHSNYIAGSASVACGPVPY